MHRLHLPLALPPRQGSSLLLLPAAQPSSLTIRLEDGSEVPPGTEVGPYREGSRLSLTCESAGGKPPAAVSWWNGTLNIGGESKWNRRNAICNIGGKSMRTETTLNIDGESKSS